MKKQMKTMVMTAIAMIPTVGLTAPAFASDYVVKSNDTFYKIAKAHHISLQKIIRANPHVDPLNLQTGQTIQLPDNKQIREAAVDDPGQVKSSNNDCESSDVNSFTVTATAYSASAEENGSFANMDYMGNTLQLGTIAVDPSVIPLGSKVYISGYDCPDLPKGGMVATATDVGSSIKGNRVDVFIPGSPEKADHFGMQNVKVKILK